MLRPRVALLWLAACGSFIALAGCGGTRSQTQQAAAVVRRFTLAVANGEGRAACALLDAHGQSMVREELTYFVKAGVTGASCPALIGFIHDLLLTPQQRAEMARKMPSEASVRGNSAHVRLDGDYFLIATRGGWRISEIPLSG